MALRLMLLQEILKGHSSLIKMDQQTSKTMQNDYFEIIDNYNYNYRWSQHKRIINRQNQRQYQEKIKDNENMQPLDLFQSSMYIDKSLFIKDIIKSISKRILITRPQGWGKRMNFELLRLFLQYKLDQKGQKDQTNQVRICKIFQKLKISKQNVMSIYRKYPVIYLNFQNIKGSSYQTIHTGILHQIIKCFHSHSYLLYSSNKCQQIYQQQLCKLLIPFKKIAFNKNTTSSELYQSINLLAKMLHLYHSKKKVFILINNYDFPINYLMQINQNNQLNQEIVKVNDLISKMVVNCINNSNDYVSMVVVNGIFDTLTKSTYSYLADFHIDNVVDGELFSHFGFSVGQIQTSLSKILADQGSIQQKMNQILQPQKTYEIKTKKIYKPQKIMKQIEQIIKNPHIILSLDAQQHDKRCIYTNLISKLFDGKINAYFYSKLLKLEQGQELQLKYDPDISLIDFIKHPSHLQSSMAYTLINTGVITKISQQLGVVNRSTYFRITNNYMLTNIMKTIRKRVRIQNERQLYSIKKQQNLNEQSYTDDQEHQKSQSIQYKDKDKRITIQLDKIFGNCLTKMAIEINNGININANRQHKTRCNRDEVNEKITIKISNYNNNYDFNHKYKDISSNRYPQTTTNINIF